jgi:hypothetical protein
MTTGGKATFLSVIVAAALAQPYLLRADARVFGDKFGIGASNANAPRRSLNEAIENWRHPASERQRPVDRRIQPETSSPRQWH